MFRLQKFERITEVTVYSEELAQQDSAAEKAAASETDKLSAFAELLDRLSSHPQTDPNARTQSQDENLALFHHAIAEMNDASLEIIKRWAAEALARLENSQASRRDHMTLQHAEQALRDAHHRIMRDLETLAPFQDQNCSEGRLNHGTGSGGGDCA